jgi:protein TonB
MQATASTPAQMERVAPVAPPPKPVKTAKITPVAPVVPRPAPKPAPLPDIATYSPTPVQPAIAPSPQQYVREVGQALAPLPLPTGVANGAIGGQGTASTMTEQTEQAIRTRYEQQISAWIEHHKFYPPQAGGREGRVIVRMRIDRMGAVRYYALEQSSGMAAIDTAALDMVRRANPLPAAPENYPAGNLIEFLIPITFRAPQ